MKWSTRLSVWLAGITLSKVRREYAKKNGTTLPTILVNGTAGKSSQTLILKGLFQNNGWTVFSGVTEQGKSLNSTTGLVMVLAGFQIDFEGKFPRLLKIWFVIRTLVFWLFEAYQLPEKTILIHEVGFDHQNESEQCINIFRDGVDILITTNITYEHTAGFNEELNHDILFKIRDLLPKKWLPVFESDSIDVRLKNIALEQLNLIRISAHYIIPASIGTIDNWVIDNLEGTVRTHFVQSERSENFAILADGKYLFSDKYILPLTFARTAHTTSLIAECYGIEDILIKKQLRTARLPNGRFSLLPGILDTTLVDSTYNSDPQSMDQFLNVFEEVLSSSSHIQETYLLSTSKEALQGQLPKHYLIFGEMRELGDTSVSAHNAVLDRIIAIGKQWGPYLENIFLVGNEWIKCDDDGIVKVQDTVSFISYHKQLFKVFSRAGDLKILLSKDTIRPRSWLWFKGSQNTIFLEIMVKRLLENPADEEFLCRRGKNWDMLRQPWE